MIRTLRNGLLAALGAVTLAQTPASAQHFDHHDRVIDVHHGAPHGYRHVALERRRFYRDFPIVRLYGPVYPGFGFWYDDALAWTYLGFTSWQLANYEMLNEEQLRAHEAAIAEASSAPLNEPISWNDAGASGNVTTVRQGQTADGRACREFQQSVTVDGKSQQAYGTACLQPDGSWKLVGG